MPVTHRKRRIERNTVLGSITILSAGLLLLGAAQRAGKLGGLDAVWQAWAAAGAGVHFAVMLLVLAGLFGAGAWAFASTWRRDGRVNLLAATGFLLAGVALLMGTTHNRQWGASETTPLVLGGMLAAGFVGILLALYRRTVARAPLTGEPESQ